MKSFRLFFLPALCIFAGCVDQENSLNLARVPGNPFGCQPPQVKSAKLNLPVPDSNLAAQVDFVGRKLLAGSPKAGLAPLFVTIGSPSIEIFHVGFKQVCVTEGLVRKCKGEQELAAVLAHELGMMAVEKATVQDYPSADGWPAAATAGNERPFDGLNFKEWGQDNDRRARARPNAQQSAQTFLGKAGYPSNILDAAQPLLREAEQHNALERQFKGLL